MDTVLQSSTEVGKIQENFPSNLGLAIQLIITSIVLSLTLSIILNHSR
jgi:hypothetical protein